MKVKAMYGKKLMVPESLTTSIKVSFQLGFYSLIIKPGE